MLLYYSEFTPLIQPFGLTFVALPQNYSSGAVLHLRSTINPEQLAAAVLTVIGLAIGLPASYGLTKLMKSYLYGVSLTDPLTFVLISATLLAAALAACYAPARRATKVDPMIALRCE